MRQKKWYLRDLVRHDEIASDCVVRDLEMTVDGALFPGHSAYSGQFWRDVLLYGVDEAILYVRNGNYGNADMIAAKWAELKGKIT